MPSEKDFKDIFKQWQELNEKTGASFGQFDFETIKEVRSKQRVLEDAVYEILVENAPDEIKKILPEKCGDMEIGFNVSDQMFYFLMYDPEQDDDNDDDAPARVIAITIDQNKKVGRINDFQID